MSVNSCHPVQKAMNKEDRYSHLVPIDEDICRVSDYLRHTIQTVVMRPGENDRLVLDGTTTLLALDIVTNQVTPVNREAPITSGHVKIQLYIDIYNTPISHPYVVILSGYHRDVKKNLIAVRPHVTVKDYNHIERILLDGCPVELKFTEPLSN